jgi:hypothetical protein
MAHGPHALYRCWLDELWHGSFETVGEVIADDFLGHWPDRDVRGASSPGGIARDGAKLVTAVSCARVPKLVEVLVRYWRDNDPAALPRRRSGCAPPAGG